MGVKMRNKRNRNNFIKVNGFVKKRKELVFVVVGFILAIFKNFCQSELLMCYHIGISPLGGLVDSFSQLYFTINLEEIFYFNDKKYRIYAVIGVSQTPRVHNEKKEKFVPCFVNLYEAIKVNEEYVKENSYDSMIERELRVMKMIADAKAT